MPAAATFKSYESLYFIASLVRVTTNSFIKPLEGTCSAFEVPYNAALLKVLGSPRGSC